MCKRSGETIDHILLHYQVAKELWGRSSVLYGVEWVMPSRVVELLGSWRG
jgi:hypothetical protein